MNEIQTFESEKFGAIRTVVINNNNNDEIWFVGKDVAEALGYKNTSRTLLFHVQEEDRMMLSYKAYTEFEEASKLWHGQDYSDKMLINESGLYSLILSSKLESAREFKHWVTSEVLPQIRKTGGYIPVHEEDDEKTILLKAMMIYKRTAEMLKESLEHSKWQLSMAQDAIEQRDDQLAEQRPMVRFANAVTSSENSILIRDLAKLITQNGVKIGQARLFYWLRLHGYLFQRENRPIQRWVEEGLFDTNETVVGGLTKLTTKVTGKGQRYFIEGFLSGRFKADNQHLC